MMGTRQTTDDRNTKLRARDYQREKLSLVNESYKEFSTNSGKRDGIVHYCVQAGF